MERKVSEEESLFGVNPRLVCLLVREEAVVVSREVHVECSS